MNLPSNPSRILVRAPNWIGDQILAYPFYYYLRRRYPRARIVVSCVSWVESIQFMNLVDEVHVLPRPAGEGWKARWEAIGIAAQELRSGGEFNLGFSLPNSLSAALLLFRAGAKERVGYGGDGRSLLLTKRQNREKSEGIHRSEAYVGLLRSEQSLRAKDFWGAPPDDPEDPGDIGTPGVQRAFDPNQSWPSAQGLVPPSEPYWVLAPGSAAESRRWPAEHFVALARQVFRETGMKGLVVGGPGEAPLAADLCSDRSAGLQDWAGQGSVASYWPIFRGARFTVSNDSGLAHVASLCGSPVQITWGAGDTKKTEPLGPGQVRIVLNPVDCWPCERNVCIRPSASKLECLRGIEADSVWKEIQSAFKVKSRR